MTELVELTAAIASAMERHPWPEWEMRVEARHDGSRAVVVTKTVAVHHLGEPTRCTVSREWSLFEVAHRRDIRGTVADDIARMHAELDAALRAELETA